MRKGVDIYLRPTRISVDDLKFLHRRLDLLDQKVIEKALIAADEHLKAGRSDLTLLASNVSAGAAYDLNEDAKDWRIPLVLKQAEMQRKSAGQRLEPYIPGHNSRAANLQLEENLKTLKEMNAALQRTIRSRDHEITRLRKNLGRVYRDLQIACSDVKVCTDDPNTYVIRPTRMAEIRAFGKPFDGIVRIVFEIPSDTSLGRLGKALHERSPHNFAREWVRLPKDFTKQLHRATKPNTRGSKSGSLRVLRALAHLCATMHTADLLEANRISDLTGRKPFRHPNAKISRILW